jgi:hypothetical protein
MEFLKAMLAEMNANMKANQEMMNAILDITQGKIDASTKAMQERMNEMEDEIKEDMNANRKVNRESLKEMMEEMMNANQAKTNADLKDMREEIKSGKAEMGSVVNAWIADMKKDRRETMSCQVTTAACLDSVELNTAEMKSESEHREVSKEDAIGKPVNGRKKRHWGRNIVAGRRGEPKELTRGECRSRRKLAASCGKVSHRAAVARRKRNVFRKILTQGHCGPRKESATAGRNITRCARVAQLMGHGLQGRSHEVPSVEKGRRNNQTRNKFARGTRKGWTLGRRQLMRQEGTNGSRNRYFEEQLRPGSEMTTSGSCRKTIGPEILKRAVDFQRVGHCGGAGHLHNGRRIHWQRQRKKNRKYGTTGHPWIVFRTVEKKRENEENFG